MILSEFKFLPFIAKLYILKKFKINITEELITEFETMQAFKRSRPDEKYNGSNNLLLHL